MSKVLVVSPHPDDESVGCGGAICVHRSRGDDVEVVFLTSGELGGHGEDPETAGPRREAEAAAAMEELGVSSYAFWRLPDGALRATTTAIERVQALLTECAPDVVYVPHDREQHRDHAAAARLVHLALARNSGREPPPSVLGFEVWTPIQQIDEIVDVSDFMQQKLRAIRCYESQCRVLPFDAAFLGLARYRGEMHSWPGGPYAEVFTRLG